MSKLKVGSKLSEAEKGNVGKGVAREGESGAIKMLTNQLHLKREGSTGWDRLKQNGVMTHKIRAQIASVKQTRLFPFLMWALAFCRSISLCSKRIVKTHYFFTTFLQTLWFWCSVLYALCTLRSPVTVTMGSAFHCGRFGSASTLPTYRHPASVWVITRLRRMQVRSIGRETVL